MNSLIHYHSLYHFIIIIYSTHSFIIIYTYIYSIYLFILIIYTYYVAQVFNYYVSTRLDHTSVRARSEEIALSNRPRLYNLVCKKSQSSTYIKF